MFSPTFTSHQIHRIWWHLYGHRTSSFCGRFVHRSNRKRVLCHVPRACRDRLWRCELTSSIASVQLALNFLNNRTFLSSGAFRHSEPGRLRTQYAAYNHFEVMHLTLLLDCVIRSFIPDLDCQCAHTCGDCLFVQVHSQDFRRNCERRLVCLLCIVSLSIPCNRQFGSRILIGHLHRRRLEQSSSTIFGGRQWPLDAGMMGQEEVGAFYLLF